MMQTDPQLPAAMRDDELLRAYCAFEDHEHLTDEQRELVAEMERRGLEL